MFNCLKPYLILIVFLFIQTAIACPEGGNEAFRCTLNNEDTKSLVKDMGEGIQTVKANTFSICENEAKETFSIHFSEAIHSDLNELSYKVEMTPAEPIATYENKKLNRKLMIVLGEQTLLYVTTADTEEFKAAGVYNCKSLPVLEK